MTYQQLDAEVQRGIDGRNLGLDLGVSKLNRYFNRLQRARYLLVGADSSVGKTTYTDALLMNTLTYALENQVKLHVKYYSFELPKIDKIMTWICMLLARDYGFECTPAYLFGRIPGLPLTHDHHELYLLARTKFYDEYLPMIDLVDYSMTPTAMFNHLLSFYEGIGTVQRETVEKGKGKLIGFDCDVEWEDGFVLGMIDHIALGTPEKGQDLKRMIDAVSRKVVSSRNILGTSWIVVQQFNTEMTSSHRTMMGKGKIENMIAPNRLDFGDSKYTFRDADGVIGLISPAQFGLLSFMGYDVSLMDTNLIIAYLMKNRYGPDRKRMATFINPLSRSVRDMPASSHEPALNALYGEVKKLQERCLLYFPTDDDLH